MNSVCTPVAAFILALFVAESVQADERPLPSTCSYEMRVWNVDSKNSATVKKVRHAYEDLASAEVDEPTGCTVCSEDQMLVDIPPLQPFSVCRRLASRVRTVVQDLLRAGAPLRTVIGYRVIRSRGSVDAQGNRTEFSNRFA